MTGIAGWIQTNMFPSWYNGLLSVLFLLFVALVISHVMGGRAQGGNQPRQDGLRGESGRPLGLRRAKLPQWIYGFYPSTSAGGQPGLSAGARPGPC
jgi:hypothetical protein